VKRIADCRLYGILDLGYVEAAHASQIAEKMIDGGVDVIQLRAKSCAPDEVLCLARELVLMTRAAGVPMIINDHPHVCRDAGAGGVHIGQDDGTLALARSASGENTLVGKSTHSVSQAISAAAEGADYIGFGPLFATPTKPDYAPIGIEEIRGMHALVTIPIFCIGGIKLENLPSVLAAGARRVVIVSGILNAPDIVSYTREAKEMLSGF
jgi:thiamine-phosphate pyrophosphorylase